MASRLEKQIAEVYAAAKGDRKKVREVAEKLQRSNKGQLIGMKKLARAIRAEAG